MSVVTTYICDRCGHAQPAIMDGMFNIAVVLRVFPYAPDIESSQLWCRKCVETVGLVPPENPRRAAEIPAPPTFEELVREIVRTEVKSK